MSKSLEDIKKLLPYIPSWHETGMCMDLRHLAMLHEVSMLGWSSVLEIGVWNGCSTAALIPAINNGMIKQYHACDIYFKDRFRKVLRRIKNNHYRLHEISSVECLQAARGHDMVIVDGDHSLPTVSKELELILKMGSVKCVVAHDITATDSGYAKCEGAKHLYEELLRIGWLLATDTLDRPPHEQTRRGLLIAVRPDQEGLAQKVRDIVWSLS